MKTEKEKPEYIPFGDEWRKFVLKLPKKTLVEMLRDSLLKNQEHRANEAQGEAL
jgi:hypothetical protein